MKTITTLLLALLVATSASAIIDPNPDHMGLYFDLDANLACIEGITGPQVIPLYLILTNPTFDEIYGFEAGLTIEGPASVDGVTINNPDALNVGSNTSLVVGFGTPNTTVPASLLATWEVWYMGNGEPVNFYLHGVGPEATFPLVGVGGGEVMEIETYNYPGYQARINDCIVPVDEVSFDQVKSFYR